MASMCFLCRIGAIGSVFIPSINNFDKSPFRNAASRSNVEVLILTRVFIREDNVYYIIYTYMQHWRKGERIDRSSSAGFPKAFALSKSKSIPSLPPSLNTS